MDERQRSMDGSSSTGPPQTVTSCADPLQPSSCRTMAAGNSSASVLSMSMASVSSEESVEVLPLAEQEEIAALTHDVRIFKESLGKLRRTFNPVDRDKHEAIGVAAHDRLGDVLRILRSVLDKYPSLHSTELLLTAGTLIQRVKGYNCEDETLESKDILDTIDQLALAFSSRVSEYLMGDLDANFSLSSSVSSKTKSCENLDSDAESIQDVHIVDKKPDLLSPQEIDSMLLKLEQGVDFALTRAKLWAKYARDVIMYIERRTHLDLEYAKNLNKLAHTVGPSIKAEPNLPLQSIYCSLLENDAANSNANQATCNLVLGNKYLEPLSARRNEHEQSRKKAKELWHGKLTQMHSAISRVRKARTSYQSCQLEWEKTRDALLRSDPSDQKYEKKKLREDEALQRVLEAETGYKACIDDANEKRIQLLKTKTEVVQKTRELILESDAVIKTATVAYFQGQYNLTSMWPHQVKTLCDRSKLYEPGSQYMEFVKRLQPNQTKDTAVLPFSFDPASNSETSQVLGKERKSTDSLDSEDLLCENFYLIDPARSVRNVQESNSFQNAHLNPTCWCRECDLCVNSQTVDCSECGSSCQKKSTHTRTLPCGHKLPREKMSTFGVDLAHHLAETGSSVPLIVSKCVDHIDERGKLIKGIYRLSGVKSKVEKLCQEFEQGSESIELADVHPNVIASVLKLYLRQLPEPLLTFQLYNDFIQIAKDCPSGSDADVELRFVLQLTEIVNKLPRAHYMTASHLIKHLQEVAASSGINHMPASNLGIVFGPTLLRTVDGSASLSSLVDTIHQTRVVELLVSHAGEIFGNKSGKSSTPLSCSSTSLYPNCEIEEISHTQPEENLRDQDLSQTTSKEQSYELTSDEELSYFLLADQASCLKASSSSSTPKIFQGSLKDYQGLEGVSLTLLGDPAEGKISVQDKLRKTMSASSVDAWHKRAQHQKPRIESLGDKPDLSQCTGSSADSEYSFESRASSLESTEVFVETPSEMSHMMEVQSAAALDLPNAATNSKQQYSAYIPVYQTHTDNTDALNIVRSKSMISETKVIRDLLKRQFLNYKEVKISVPHMSMACVQSSFKNTSYNGSSGIQTNIAVQMEPDCHASLSEMPSASEESCTPICPDDEKTLEISPDECVPYVSFENEDSLGEEHTGC